MLAQLVYVSKQDLTTGEKLKGAVLTVTEKWSNKVVQSWVSDGTRKEIRGLAVNENVEDKPEIPEILEKPEAPKTPVEGPKNHYSSEPSPYTYDNGVERSQVLSGKKCIGCGRNYFTMKIISLYPKTLRNVEFIIKLNQLNHMF